METKLKYLSFLDLGFHTRTRLYCFLYRFLIGLNFIFFSLLSFLVILFITILCLWSSWKHNNENIFLLHLETCQECPDHSPKYIKIRNYIFIYFISAPAALFVMWHFYDNLIFILLACHSAMQLGTAASLWALMRAINLIFCYHWSGHLHFYYAKEKNNNYYYL